MKRKLPHIGSLFLLSYWVSGSFPCIVSACAKYTMQLENLRINHALLNWFSSHCCCFYSSSLANVSSDHNHLAGTQKNIQCHLERVTLTEGQMAILALLLFNYYLGLLNLNKKAAKLVSQDTPGALSHPCIPTRAVEAAMHGEGDNYTQPAAQTWHLAQLQGQTPPGPGQHSRQAAAYPPCHHRAEHSPACSSAMCTSTAWPSATFLFEEENFHIKR